MVAADIVLIYSYAGMVVIHIFISLGAKYVFQAAGILVSSIQ